MAKISMTAIETSPARFRAGLRVLLCAAVGASALGLAGCALELQNRQAAQEVSRMAKPPGSIYSGWRVFQDRCARCHGATATGSANAPDLLTRVRTMSARRFVGLVLQRYDLNQPTARTGGDSAATEALVEVIMQRKEAPLTMPAWENEPVVNVHIVDLYAYLSARAEGTQGPDRPLP